MSKLSIHNPTHRAIWGQCLGDSIASHLSNTDPIQTWKDFKQQRKLPYKRGHISIYAKQMMGLVELRLQHSTIRPNEFNHLAAEYLHRNTGHTLLCRAIKEKKPYVVPDMELAVRVGPLATCYTDLNEMLDTIYGLIKLFSTHPHAIVGTLAFAAHSWNQSQEVSIETADLFHAMRNWSIKTDIPSETWWVFEQAIRILEQRYPLQEMLDFVNNITQQPKETLPSPRQSLSVLPLMFQQQETDVDWSYCLQPQGGNELLMNLKGCLLGLRYEIPNWLAVSLSHIKALQAYPIQHLEPKEQQLRLFDL